MITFEIIKENIDLDGIGEVAVTWDFDEEEYREYLTDNELEDSKESLDEYIKDCVEFELEYFDNDTYHHCGFDSCYYDDLEDTFGERFTLGIINDIREKGESRFETASVYNSEEYDPNNPDELNAVAEKMFNSGQYYKDCRGYILTNGTVIYTPMEHNQISMLNGVEGTFDFIRKGNIRVLDHSIDLGAFPTPEQISTLRKVIASYRGDVLYADFMTQGGTFSKTYDNPDFEWFMNDVKKAFANVSECVIKEGFDNTADIFSLAKKRFGVTNDIRECGYILPDGKMLDFSGRHESGDEYSVRGTRNVDHDQIEDAGWSDDLNTKNFDLTMSNFIKMGAVRVSFTESYCFINLAVKPTRQQMNAIASIVRYAKGCLDVEIGDGNESLSYAEYDNAKPSLVTGEINRYFSEGVKLRGNMNESRNLVKESAYMYGTCDDMELFVDDESAAYYNFEDSDAYPFLVYDGRLFIGDKGKSHLYMKTHDKSLSGVNLCGETVCGRVWTKPKSSKFDYSVVAFWGDLDNGKSGTNYRPYVYSLAKRLGIRLDKLVVATETIDWQIKLTPYAKWNGSIHTSSGDEYEARNLHMMDSQEKMNNTEDFRTVRDKKNAEKLTGENGEEMPMAKYRSMIYQEGRKPAKVIISEEQYKRLFRVGK